MLAFAERAEAPMYYVSTAFVANPPSAEGGPVRRRAGVHRVQDRGRAAHPRQRRAPTVILRPSVVIGDSRDGRMAAFQGLHRVAGHDRAGHGAADRLRRDALIDTVPQDVVAAATGQLIRARASPAASSG